MHQKINSHMSKEIHDLAAKAVKYVNSKKGQAEIKSALETSSKVTASLKEERKITSKDLYDTMTI
ncbi:hypothetical protein GF406_14450 [candidate division KSB1 bacterium]|nr:hypothetical protein [candidate division KSB1 bacterium]